MASCSMNAENFHKKQGFFLAQAVFRLVFTHGFLINSQFTQDMLLHLQYKRARRKRHRLTV